MVDFHGGEVSIEQAIKSSAGEYMEVYSWAEMTLARLERLTGRNGFMKKSCAIHGTGMGSSALS